MDLICDTNIWYELAYGDIDVADLKRNGARLLATPLSLLEISSKLDQQNFEGRRNAAKALLDHADEILPEPEHHLANIWRVPHSEPFDWAYALRTVANSKSLSDLQSGVMDFESRLRMKLDTAFATNWRLSRYDEFVDDMESVIDTFWQGYKAARKVGKAIHMPKELGELFDKATRYPEQLKQYAIATFSRVSPQSSDSEAKLPDESIINEVVTKLDSYTRVYQAYVVRLATLSVPRPNDLGDLECFLYAQDGRRVLTHDKIWNEIAIAAGCKAAIFDPLANVGEAND